MGIRTSLFILATLLSGTALGAMPQAGPAQGGSTQGGSTQGGSTRVGSSLPVPTQVPPAGGGALGAPFVGDFERPRVSFASSGATIAEDSGAFQVPVRIDLKYTRTVRIPYILLGDAVEGVDYVVSPASPLVLEAGEREVLLTITPLGDGIREADELVRVRLQRPDWAGLEKPRRFDLVLANDDCVVPEDFNDCEGLVAPWGFVDPIGDAGVAVNGVGTDDAWAEISVPAGSDHLPLGTSLPARVLTPASDGDCTLGCKIESAFTADGQHQGVLLEQDDAEWLQFGIYSASGGTNVLLASTTGGVTTPVFDAPIAATAPFWLKSRRVGANWIFSWSDDGVAWVDLPLHGQALVLNQVGLYAGNVGGATAPAHTASFDWFDDLSFPIVVEDGPFTGSGPFTLTTAISPPAAETAGCFVTVEPAQASYTCSDFVTLTAVAAPGWVFDFWQDDLSGTENPQTIQMTADRLATAVFLSDPNPPVISNVQVLATSTSALVTWDTDEPATSFVEWGPTAGYGNSLADGSLVTAHALLIEGLDPASVVHFQVCSTDLAQNQGCSGDATFSTSILSEDFNDCFGLVAPWSFVDPIGDAELAPRGAGTDDAWIELTVPAGTTHLPEDGLLAARIVQPVGDPDLAFVTKIESEFTADGQHQGVLVEQDAAEWLRFEVYSGGGTVNAFLGSTTGGVTTPAFDAPIAATAPYWLRTIRAGDDFVFGWSDDGVVWNDLPIQAQVLAVAQIGLYAGNSGAAPAHTASFDYVEDLAEPLVTEDGPFAGSGPFTLTTVVSPPAAEGAGCSITVEPVQPSYTCSDVVTVTAIAAPGWVFDVWQDDVTGIENPQTIQMTADRLATAVFLSDPNPPVISNVQVLATSSSALVTWDTDEPATSLVEWGPTAGYGDSLSDGALVTAHALLVTGLESGAEYHFRVCSTDLAQNPACSPDGLFATTMVTDDFNHCEGLVAPWTFLDPIGDATLVVSGVGTDDATVDLGIPGGSNHVAFGSALPARLVQPVADRDFQFSLRFDSALELATQIQGVLVEEDEQNWVRFDLFRSGGGVRAFVATTTAGATTTVADVPFNLSPPMYLRVTRVGDDWTFEGMQDIGQGWSPVAATNFPLAPSQVGLYAGNSGGGSAPAHTARVDWFEDATEPLVTEDGSIPGSGPFDLDVTIQGLGQVLLDPDQPQYTCSDVVTLTAIPDPAWLFDRWEGDLTGGAQVEQLAMTADRVVTAVFVPDLDAPVISNVQVVANTFTAWVTWDTDEPATSLVEYGLDAGYGSAVGDGSLVTSHALELTGLLPGTTYHFRVCSADFAGNTGCSADATFDTLIDSGLVSDDFNHCEGLIAPWSYVDPIGDGSFQVVGVGTDDAWVQLFVPGGSTHVPFDAALPPRIVQQANDVDLEFEVKFESSLDQAVQLQGATIEQDGLNWIRFDVYRGAGGLFAYVGDTVGGVTTQIANVALGATPPYLRVARVGDDWTMEASDDPQVFGWTSIAAYTRALMVTQVGLYGGNAGGVNAPAHVASVDWFENPSSPLATEDGSFPGSGPFFLTTNVFGSGTVERLPDQPSYNCADIVTLTPVADPGWDFDRWEGDLTGSMEPAQLTMSADRTVDAYFVADVDPPVITNVIVEAGVDSALVTWDTDEPATSRVDYGATPAYGSFVEDPSLTTSHAVVLSGLASGAIYHFSVTSVDDGGLSTSTPDDVFQTQSNWTAVSDDFNQCGDLLPHWTFIDPQGDAPLPIVQGVGTDDAQLVLSVPGGSDHEAFDSIQAPHLVQSVNDVDFELEVKFDSSPSLAYQIQGVLVKQDDFRWLRFDFYSTASQVRVYAGSTVAGDTSTLVDIGIGSVPGPLWLNVERLGDQWTLRYSTDGVTFTAVLVGVTEALLVDEVGVYVGNGIGGSAPAYTALVDYFFDLAEPIDPEDGPFGGGGPFTLTTAVDPPGTGTVLIDPDQVDYTCSDTVELTAVAQPGWMFASWSGDLTSNLNPETLAMSADRSVTANFVPDLDPPVITQGPVVSLTETTALVSWETDELADGLVEYGLTSMYTDQVFDPEFVTQHSILLTGLMGETQYNYKVSTADPGGLVTSTGNLTFTTPGPSNVTSDDFNHPNLDLGLWEWVDPLAGAGGRSEESAKLRVTGAGTGNAHLEIQIPTGVEYRAAATNNSARVLQAIADDDFELEVKFNSVLNKKGQSVGVAVEEDSDTWFLFDFRYTGSALQIRRSSFDAGVGSNYVAATIQSGAWNGQDLWMRVQRVGDTWTQSYSLDGTNFVPNGAALVLPFVATKLGPLAANEEPNKAGVVARVDYFFSTTSPIVPEDFGSPADAVSPYLYLARGREISDSEVRLHWATEELSTSSVSWGTSAGTYDLGTANGASLVYQDTVLVTGLLPATTYHFQVSALDGAGNPATLSDDFTVTTAPPGEDGFPDIEIWYGQPDGMGANIQRFGVQGTAQTWVNVLGNVQDAVGEVQSLTYTLNNTQTSGVVKSLSIGQGGFTFPYRLVGAGDFNVEIAAALLDDDSVGLNEVLVTATDLDGHVTQSTVWIDYDADTAWPETVGIDWSTVTDLQDVIQLVDGEWEIDPTGGYLGTPALRNSRAGVAVPGYDRLFLVGDAGWDDYEFEFEVTVNALNPAGYFPDSNSHAVGVIVRWPGHNGGSQQPQEDFFPLGGLYAYRWYDPGVDENWQFYSSDFVSKTDYPNFFQQVAIAQTYMFKGSCETTGNKTTYRMKSWEIDSPEPPDDFGEVMVIDANDGNYVPAGSLLFLAHEVDASFGNITITPLN